MRAFPNLRVGALFRCGRLSVALKVVSTAGRPGADSALLLHVGGRRLAPFVRMHVRGHTGHPRDVSYAASHPSDQERKGHPHPGRRLAIVQFGEPPSHPASQPASQPVS
jgi:hypothetical protein